MPRWFFLLIAIVFAAAPAAATEYLSGARDLPLARWLHALAIPEVGEETAHDLAKFHPSLEAVRDYMIRGGHCRLVRSISRPVSGAIVIERWQNMATRGSKPAPAMPGRTAATRAARRV